MTQIGIDIGSTFTKYCVMDREAGIVRLCSERTPVRQREHFAEKIPALRREYKGCAIVTCGYGRENAPHDRMISELTALAAGGENQCPGMPVLLDIGGQDTKVVRQEHGRLRAFFTNEKCAAGCGLFLGNTIRMLQMDFSEIDLTGRARPERKLSSVCAVFAQTEIVELLAGGVPEEEILCAVLEQILVQARTLLNKVERGPVVLSGGLTRIPGIREFAEAVLDRPVTVPPHGAYLSAIGCALAGLE